MEDDRSDTLMGYESMLLRSFPTFLLVRQIILEKPKKRL
ncbi:hypothetical protein CU040_1921 [Enterococcus faecium]|nr:hypothetical protein [Enterococcus faecium]